MSAIEELLERLGEQPSDPEILARFTGACLESGEHDRLLAGYRDVLGAVPAEARPGVASALARQLEARARDAGQRDAAELLLRAASLRRLLDGKARPDAVATTLSEAWGRFPDARLVEEAWNLLGAPPVEEAPDALLLARAEVAPPQTRRVVLGVLADRWLEAGRVEEARGVLHRLAELAPDDPQITRRLEALGASPPAEEADREAPPPAEATEQPRGEAPPDPEDVQVDDASGEEASARPKPRSGKRLPLDTVPADEEEALALAESLRGRLRDAGPAEQILLRRRLFHLLAESLDAPDEAAEALRFTGAAPEDTREALDSAAARVAEGDAEQAVRDLGEAARRAEDREAQIALMLEEARLLEAIVGDPERAEKVYRRLRIVEPQSLPVLGFYRDWYAVRDEPRREHATLAQLHGALEGPALAEERVSVATHMAHLATDHLDSADKAIEAWRRVLADDPEHQEANEALRRLYAETGRWHALADHLDTWIRALPPDAAERKVELLFDLIGIYQDPERLPMDDMVIATYQRIVELSPTDRTALDSLARRYEDRERWADLVDVLGRKVELTTDPAELLELFGRIADLYLEHIRSDTEAIPVLERILELDPGHIDVIRKLRQIYRRRHDSERLYATYQRELALLDGPEELDVLVELAHLATDELFRHDEAIAWWRKVLELRPDDEHALAALQELTADEEDWPAHVKLLEQRIDAASTRKKRVELLHELGEIVHRRLGDEERALEIFAEICELSPFNSRARSFLQDIYVARRQWAELLELFAPREDWKGYVGLLREEARKAGDPEMAADLHAEIARAQVDLIGDRARARKSLLAGLEAAPHRVDLARRLLEDAAELDDDARREALGVVAREAEDPGEREDAWRDLAAALDGAGDTEAAHDAWGRALLLGADHGRVDALAPFEAAAEATGSWEDTSGTLSEALGRLPDHSEEARISVHRSLGALHRSRLGDPEGAVAHYRWVLQLGAGDPEALEALEEIHLSRHDFEGLEEVLRVRAEQAPDPADARAARERLGQLYEDVFTDSERAAAVYRELLDQEPDDDEALASLRRVLATEGAWPDLIAALEELVPRVEDPARRAAMQLDLAGLYRERADDPAMAVEHLRDLLEHPDADHAAVVETLESMLAAGEAADAVAPALEQRHRDTGDAGALARVLEARLRLEEAEGERMALAEELAGLYEQELADPASAFAACATAFRLDPDDRDRWEELKRLAGLADGWEELAELWRSAVARDPVPDAPRPTAPTERDALRVELAYLLRAHVDGEDEAIAWLERILEDAGAPADHPAVLGELEALYRQREAHEDRLRILLYKAEAAGAGARWRDELLAAAELLTGPLGRLDDAAKHLARLVEADPSDGDAADRLEEVYEALDRWEDLVALLTIRARAVTDAGEADRMVLRRAFARLEHLGDAPGAVEELLSVVASEAVGGDARDVLLDLAARGDLDEEVRGRLVEELEAWFRDTGDVWGRAALLEVRAEAADSGEARAGLLGEAAGALVPDPSAPVEDPAAARRAFELHRRALEAAPRRPEAAEALEALADALDDLEAWADQLETLAGQQRDADSAALDARLAGLAEGRLDDPERAIAAWQRVASAGPSVDPALRGEALDALDRLYGEVGRPEDRVEVLLGRAELSTQPSTRLAYFKEAAELLRSLDRPDEAIDVLHRILEETRATRRSDLLAEREAAIGALEELLSAAGRDEELLDLLVEGAESFRDAERARIQLLRAAELAESRLDDPARAVELLERVRATAPDDPEALDGLDRLYPAVERWEDKAALAEHRLALAEAEEAPDPERWRTLLFTLGQLRENRLGDPSGAVEAYARLLAREPDFPPARAALSTHAADGATGPEARRALAEAYGRTGDFPELIDVLEARLAAGDLTGDEADGARLELARRCLEDTGEPERAWPHMAEALGNRPPEADDDDRRALATRVALAADRADALVEGLVESAAAAPDADARRAHLEADVARLREAGTAEEDLAPLYRALLDAAPDHPEALDVLERIARKAGRSEELAQLLERREDASDDPAEQRALRLERGDLLATLPGRQMDAALAWEAILSDEPTDDEAFARLERIHRELGRWVDLADLLDLRLASRDDPAERVGDLESLGELAWRRLDDPDRAVSLFAELLELRPDDPDAVEALEAMWGEGVEREPIFRVLEPHYEARADWDKLVALYMSTLEEEGRTDLQIECLQKVARIELEELDDPRAAFESTRALVLRADEPEDHLEGLEALAEQLGDWDALAEIYEALMAEGRASPQLVKRLAFVVRDQLGDADRAARHLAVALERAPEDEEARAALTRLLTEGGRWRELVRHLEAMADAHLDMDAKLARHHEAADVLVERLDAPGEAATLLQRALELEPTDRHLADRIATLLEATGDRERLHEHYAEWIRRADEETADELRMRLVASELRDEDTASAGLEELRALLASQERRDAAMGVVRAFLTDPEHSGDAWRRPVQEAAALLKDAVGDDLTPAQRAEMAEARLRVVGEAAERRALRVEAAAFHDAAGAPEVAFEHYARVLRAKPSDGSIREQVEDLAVRNGRQTALEERYEAWVDGAAEDLAERHGLHTALAELYEACVDAAAEETRPRYLEGLARLQRDRLDEPAAAARTFERLLEHRPDDADALDWLVAYYREAGSAEDEARCLESLLAADAGEASAVRRRLAVLRMDALEDDEGAMALLEEELPDAAREPDLRARLERLYGSEGHFRGLVALYDAALEDDDLDEPTRLELLAKKAQIAEVRLDDPDTAARACAAILELDPRHPFGLSALERVERRRERWDAVDEVLARRIEGAEDDAARAELLVARASNAEAHLERPEDALALAREAEELAEEPLSNDLLDVYQRLLRHEATRVEAAARLEPRYEQREDWRGLVSVLAMQQAAAEDPDDRLAFARRMARLTGDRLREPAAALRILLGVFPEHAHRPELRDDAHALAEASGRWETAAIEAEKVLGREDDTDRVRDLGLWLGRIQREHLGDAAGAIRSYERVLAVDELNQEAMEALDALYRDQGRWREVRRLLDARLATVADADRWQVVHELARLVTEEEGPGAALGHWRELLWERPRDEEARGWLEQMLDDRHTLEAAAEILEPLYRKEGAWEPLARLLERRIAGTEDPSALTELHARAADIYDTRLDREAEAFDHYAKALEGSPGDVDRLRRLERIAHKLERWTELADVLDRIVPALGDQARTVEILLHAAQIHEVKAGKPDRAVDALRRVLAIDPDHRAALMGLRRLYGATGDRAAQLEVTAGLARTAREPAQAAKLWAEVRDLADEEGDEDLVAAACQSLLEQDPDDDGTAERLLDLFDATGRHDDAATLLRERLERSHEPHRAAALRTRLGRILEAHLDDADGAVAAYAEALEHDPTRDDARDALAELYRRREDWEALYTLLATHADRVADPEEAVALWLKLGTLADQELREPTEAIRAWERALELAPEDPTALAELVRVTRATDRRDALAPYAVRLARVTDEPDERLSLLAEAARLYAGPLEAPEEAEALLDEILAADPEHLGAMGVLARLREADGRHEEAAEVLDKLAARAEGTEQVEALIALGRIYRERLDRPHDALKALLEARALAPDDPALHEVLRDLFERTGSWDELKEVLEREYEAATSPNERCDRALALARLHEEHLDDDRGFLDWIERARQARLDSPEVAEALIAFHERREQWDEVAPRLEWLVNYLHGKKLMDALPARAHELGRLLERLDRPDEALDYYKIALQADGTFVPNLLDYGRLLVERERWDPALRVHQNLMMQRKKLAPADQADVLYRLAATTHALGQDAKARGYLERLLAETPDHAPARALRDELS